MCKTEDRSCIGLIVLVELLSETKICEAHCFQLIWFKAWVFLLRCRFRIFIIHFTLSLAKSAALNKARNIPHKRAIMFQGFAVTIYENKLNCLNCWLKSYCLLFIMKCFIIKHLVYNKHIKLLLMVTSPNRPREKVAFQYHFPCFIFTWLNRALSKAGLWILSIVMLKRLRTLLNCQYWYIWSKMWSNMWLWISFLSK